MKRWLVAWLCVGLVPALGLAQEAPPQGPEPEAPSEPAPAVEAPPAEAPAQTPSAAVAPPGTPAPAAAPTNATLQTPAQLAAQTGWSVLALVGSTVGHGTFVKPDQVAYADLGVTVQPRFNFRGPAGVRLVAAAAASASFEFTRPDNATGRRLDWTDLRLSLSAPAVYQVPVAGVVLTPVASLTVPATLRSWWAGSLGVLGAGVGLNKTLERWIFNYQLSGSRGFHTSATIGPEAPASGGDVRRDADGHALDICRAGQQLCASAGFNTAWSLSQSLGATFIPSEQWFATVGVGLTNQWRYAATDAVDPYTPPTRDANGNPVAHVGMGRNDVLSVSLGAGYNLTERMSLSVGASSVGPPLSRDNKRLRVPFVEGAVLSTSYSVSLSALY